VRWISFALKKVKVMEGEFVTTPFGRRAMSFGMLANQVKAEQIKPGQVRRQVEALSRTVRSQAVARDHRSRFGRLNALLSFYPQNRVV
jgi:replication initiation protein RepC